MMTFLDSHDIINLKNTDTSLEGEGTAIDLILTSKKNTFDLNPELFTMIA